jgi:hypothetical protein
MEKGPVVLPKSTVAKGTLMVRTPIKPPRRAEIGWILEL